MFLSKKGRISQNFPQLEMNYQKEFPRESSTSRTIPSGSSTSRTFPSRSSMLNIILSKEVEDSSSIFQAYQASYPMRNQKILPQKFKPIKYHPHGGSKRHFLNSSGISSIIPMDEVEESSPMDPSTLKQILNKETEDSSPKHPQ